MGRVAVKLFVQGIDLGRPEASEYLDEFLFDSRGIDLLGRVRLVTKDYLLYSRDVGATESLRFS